MWIVFGNGVKTTRVPGGARVERHCEQCGELASFYEKEVTSTFRLYFVDIFDYERHRVMACGCCGACYGTDELGLPGSRVPSLGERAARAAHEAGGYLDRAADALEAGVSSLLTSGRPATRVSTRSLEEEAGEGEDEAPPPEARLRVSDKKPGVRIKIDATPSLRLEQPSPELLDHALHLHQPLQRAHGEEVDPERVRRAGHGLSLGVGVETVGARQPDGVVDQEPGARAGGRPRQVVLELGAGHLELLHGHADRLGDAHQGHAPGQRVLFERVEPVGGEDDLQREEVAERLVVGIAKALRVSHDPSLTAISTTSPRGGLGGSTIGSA